LPRGKSLAIKKIDKSPEEETMFNRVSTARVIASISLVFASFLAAQSWAADTKTDTSPPTTAIVLHYIEAAPASRWS